MREKLEKIIRNAADIDDSIPVIIEVPSRSEHGHFATNVAMTLASKKRLPPKKLAELIVKNIEDKEGIIEKIEIAGPGFINFWINDRAWYKALLEVLSNKEKYGSQDLGKGKKVIIEFVSANPTGPLHIGHARGAALGDSLSRIMDFLGYRVTREFYINDAGQQIRLLGESIYSRYKQLSEPDYPFPENGYHGEYIIELAQMISKETDLSSMPKEEAVKFCAERGKEIMLEQIKKDLEAFKVSFDTWFSEKSLYESGLLSKTLNELKNKGLLYEKDGAVWIRTSQFGDDKDRVLRKSDGQFTYFASDIAYHLDKKKRGFDQAINIWGADHHGYIPRLKAALVSQEFPEDWLRVLLIQLVKLWKEGKEVKMSKRSGEFITFRELMEEVGVDAMRFVFLTKSHDSSLDFDIDLVKRQDAENPVYYVQYAHARICSILRKAKERGISFRTPDIEELSCLKLPEEIELIRNVVEFPYVLKEIALHLEPHRLTYYLTSLASVFHRYFNLGTSRPELRVVSDDSALTNVRLALSEAVRVVIEKGLTLLGVSAPERM